jgi:hypothetical protein
VAFFARAVVEPELGQFMRDTWIHSHEFIAGHISACIERGEIEPSRDHDLEAARGLALADGLASHILLGHYTEEQALSVLDAYLDDLFSTQAAQA